MAIRSSTMAKAARKILSPEGTLLPKSDSIPRAKAMSVAIGIPQPLAVKGFCPLKKK
ncbi:hypothetical protein D3C85_1057760 [compost metagenome]